MANLVRNYAHWKGTTRYRRSGKKVITPISDKEFDSTMKGGTFLSKNHKAYVELLYYTAVRRLEALRVVKEQFTVTHDTIIFSVGKRLKHGIETPELKIPLDKPYTYELEQTIKQTGPGKRVFMFCPKTAYNIVTRAGFPYCHFFRLSRITNFFSEHWTISQVHSWTGLSLTALNYYLGLVDIDAMSKSLK